jgi:hypothetical protein
MLETVMVSVIEAATPPTIRMHAFPALPNRFVILGAGKIRTIFKEVQIDSQALLVIAVPVAVPLLFTDLAMKTGISVSIPKGNFIPLVIDPEDKFCDHLAE